MKYIELIFFHHNQNQDKDSIRFVNIFKILQFGINSTNFMNKTSTKGLLASKCDVGNWIFSKLGTFREIVWNFFSYFWFFLDFLGGTFWEDFFGRNFWEDFLRGLFWEDCFRRILFGRIFLGGILCLYC